MFSVSCPTFTNLPYTLGIRYTQSNNKIVDSMPIKLITRNQGPINCWTQKIVVLRGNCHRKRQKTAQIKKNLKIFIFCVFLT